MAKIVITEHRPLRAFLLVLVAVVLSVAAVGGYFTNDVLDTRVELSRVSALTRSLKDASQELQKQNLELRQSLVNLERTRQVEVKAYAGVELHLTELQNRILSLEEEVAFYRGIVSSTGKRGVSVQRLFMFPRLEAGKFRFQVVLTRDMKSDKVQKGTLSLSVAGEQNGESRKLSAAKLFGTNGSELEFSFRFFQRLEGEISLPLEFVPRRVHVKIKAPGEVPASAERTFDWVVTSG